MKREKSRVRERAKHNVVRGRGHKDGIRLRGLYTAELIRDGEVIWTGKGENMVMDEGMHHMLSRCFDEGTASAVTQWYMGLATTITSAADNSTGSQLNGTGAVTEMVDYDNDTSRNAIDFASPSGRAIAGTAAVQFTFDTGVSAVTINGFFICGGGSAANQGGTATYLWCVCSLSPAPVVNATDILNITYSVDYGTTAHDGTSDGSP